MTWSVSKSSKPEAKSSDVTIVLLSSRTFGFERHPTWPSLRETPDWITHVIIQHVHSTPPFLTPQMSPVLSYILIPSLDTRPCRKRCSKLNGRYGIYDTSKPITEIFPNYLDFILLPQGAHGNTEEFFAIYAVLTRKVARSAHNPKANLRIIHGSYAILRKTMENPPKKRKEILK